MNALEHVNWGINLKRYLIVYEYTYGLAPAHCVLGSNIRFFEREGRTMAQIESTAVYEIIVKGTASEQAVLNVIHYATEETIPVPPIPTEEQFLAQFVENWRTAVLAVLSQIYRVESYTLKRITGTEVDPSPPPPTRLIVPFQFGIPGGLGDFGARVGEPLPTYSAVGYRKLTSNPTRNGRGGMRLGPVLESDTTGGNALNAGALALFAVANLESIRRVLIAAVANFPMQMQVFSETLALVAPNVTPRNFSFPVSALALNPFITTQTTRKQRTGSA